MDLLGNLYEQLGARARAKIVSASFNLQVVHD